MAINDFDVDEALARRKKEILPDFDVDEALKRRQELFTPKAPTVTQMMENKGQELKAGIKNYDDLVQSIGDAAKGFVDSGTYGHAGDLAGFVVPEKPETKQAVENSLKEAEERSPLAFALGGMGGFAYSPETKAIEWLGGKGGKLFKMLSNAEEVAKNPLLKDLQKRIVGSKALSGLAKALGYTSETLAPGAAFVAAQKGDSNAKDLGMGAAVNAAVKKAPAVAGPALIASMMADKAQGENRPGLMEYLPLAAGAGAGLLGYAAKLKVEAINRGRDPAALKKPIEMLEDAYEKTGAETPPERFSETRPLFRTPRNSPRSDRLQSIYDRMDEIKLAKSGDVSPEVAAAYGSAAKKLGELRHKPLNEIMASENPAEQEMVYQALDELNKATGSKQSGKDTFKSQIETITETLPSANISTITPSDLILARIRQTPIRHLRAFVNVFSESRRLPDYEHAVPDDIKRLYMNALQAREDVNQGRLNKWLRDTEMAGTETPDYIRLFDAKKPWNLLNDKQIEERMKKGQRVVFAKELKKIQQQGTTQPSAPEKKLAKEAALQETSEAKTAMPGGAPNKFESGLEKDLISSKDPLQTDEARQAAYDSELAGLTEILQNMAEGKRQMTMRHPPTLTDMAKDVAMRLPLLKNNEVRNAYEAISPNSLRKIMKFEEHWRDQYGRGKQIENMPAVERPQILRLKELAQRNDKTGDVAKNLFQAEQDGTLEGFLKAPYFEEEDHPILGRVPVIRKYIRNAPK